MAGISGSGTSTGATGTNPAPVSFPGISSGIDYNSIIQKLTTLTLAPAKQYQAQITQISAANSELIKINSLLSSVQNAINALSDPKTFNAFSATSSNSAFATALDNGSGIATPGSYILTNSQLATASYVAGATTAGHKLSDVLTADSINPANDGKTSDTVPLAESFAAITPTNGGNQRAQITVDGVQVSYDVSSDSLQTIVARIQTAVASVDPGFTIAYNSASDTVSLNSTDQPISIGSPSDRGNLLTVLKIDVAQVNNTATSGSVVSAGSVGGINQAVTFDGNNYAGLTTPLTGADGSFFTINGVKIVINQSTDNLASVLQKINSSAAGVVASYNTTTNQVTLTSKTTGPSGIVLGSTSSGDTSNFLAAVGLGAGATTSVGKQASATVLAPSGSSTTYYSNTNSFATAIPGLNLNIFQNTTSVNPVTFTIGADTSKAISAINTFTSAYNATINEINNATAAPVVKQANAGTGTQATTASSSVVANGGALYNDFTIEQIKNRLITLAENVIRGSGSTSYQSLQSIGLSLDSTHAQLQATASDATGSASNGPVTVAQSDGTSGAFLPLNVTAFQNAFAANPNAVTNIFQGSDGVVQSFGRYLTTVTGLPTTTVTGLLGTVPSTSLLQSDENGNSAQIKSLQDYITQINNEANAQADQLRTQFTSSETLIAQYQSVQSQIGQLNQGLS